MATALTAAAAVHSLDMAERGSPGHDGSRRQLGRRAHYAHGFVWQISGENVAAGQRDAKAPSLPGSKAPGIARL